MIDIINNAIYTPGDNVVNSECKILKRNKINILDLPVISDSKFVQAQTTASDFIKWSNIQMDQLKKKQEDLNKILTRMSSLEIFDNNEKMSLKMDAFKKLKDLETEKARISKVSIDRASVVFKFQITKISSDESVESIVPPEIPPLPLKQ